MKLKDNSTQEIDTALYQLEQKLKSNIRLTDVENSNASTAKINAVDKKLTEEIKDRQSADEKLQDNINKEIADRKDADAAIENAKQDKLIAGDNIQIDGNVISATSKEYTAEAPVKVTDGKISLDTVPIAKGGTGATTAKEAFMNLTNGLSDDVNPIDTEHIIFKNTDGTNWGLYTLSHFWNYIKSKISSVLGLTKDNYGGKAATAGTADKVANALTVNGKTYDGSSAVNAGVQTVANGGTGVTTQADINKAFVGGLSVGNDDVTDGTEFVSSWATDNGFAETGALNKPYKRQFIKVWNYIKGKISSVLGLTENTIATLRTNADQGYLCKLYLPAYATQTYNVILLGKIPDPASTEAPATPSVSWDIDVDFYFIRAQGHKAAWCNVKAGYGYSNAWRKYGFIETFGVDANRNYENPFYLVTVKYNNEYYIGVRHKCDIDGGYSARVKNVNINGNRNPSTADGSSLVNMLKVIPYQKTTDGTVLNSEVKTSIVDFPNTYAPAVERNGDLVLKSGYVKIGDGGVAGSKLTIQGKTVNTNSYSDTNPKLEFKNNDGSQNISLTFTDFDAVQAPASLTLNGNQGNEYFIAPNIKATGKFYGDLSGKASTAVTADKATNDGNGNDIVNTYATKTALDKKANVANTNYKTAIQFYGNRNGQYVKIGSIPISSGTVSYAALDIDVFNMSPVANFPVGSIKLNMSSGSYSTAFNINGYSSIPLNDLTNNNYPRIVVEKTSTDYILYVNSTYGYLSIAVTEGRSSKYTRGNFEEVSTLSGTVVYDSTVDNQIILVNGSADKATSVVDYGDTSKTIQIGYTGAGATVNNLSHIAGYLTGGTQIKDVSKSVLQSWLGLSNYLPLSGGTVTGATQFNNYVKLNAWPNYGTGTANFWYDGNNKFVEIENATDLKLSGVNVSKVGHKHSASDITSGVLQVEHGGTGCNTAEGAANSLIASLPASDKVPVDSDYFISQVVNGGPFVPGYQRRPVSKLWEYIKGKILQEGEDFGYNHIVYDDASLLEWANCTDGSMKKVLIKSGTYNMTKGVDFSKAGTGYVFAENGAVINSKVPIAFTAPSGKTAVHNLKVVCGPSSDNTCAFSANDVLNLILYDCEAGYSNGTVTVNRNLFSKCTCYNCHYDFTYSSSNSSMSIKVFYQCYCYNCICKQTIAANSSSAVSFSDTSYFYKECVCISCDAELSTSRNIKAATPSFSCYYNCWDRCVGCLSEINVNSNALTVYSTLYGFLRCQHMSSCKETHTVGYSNIKGVVQCIYISSTSAVSGESNTNVGNSCDI